MRTIYILWLRQIKKYFRSKSRMIGMLGQPLLFLIAFGFGFGSIYSKAGEGNYIQYLAPGIMLMGVLSLGVFSGVDMIWDRQFGFLKETMVAPVPRWQILVGKVLGGATIATFQGIIIFVLSLLVGFRPTNWTMLPIGIVLIFLVAMLFTSLGTVIASNLEDMQGFQLVMNFLVMPTNFLSGAFFPISNFPKTINYLTRINPMTYGMDGLRQILINQGTFSLTTDLIVLIGFTIVLIFLGTYFFEKIQA